MLRALHKKLKIWENCKIRMKETKELLDFIESKGMQPPNIHIDLLFPNSEISSSTNHYFALWEPENEKDNNTTQRRRTTKFSR